MYLIIANIHRFPVLSGERYYVLSWSFVSPVLQLLLPEGEHIG